MTSLLTRGCQQGGGGRGARLLAVRWGPEPGGGCTGRCCAAPRRGRRQWESVSAPAQLKLLFKAGAGKSTREMRRGRFWERPRIPLPVGAAAPGQLRSRPGGAGVAGGWEPTRGVRAVMRQDSLQIPARCRLRPSACCCASGRAGLPQRVTAWGTMAGGRPLLPPWGRARPGGRRDCAPGPRTGPLYVGKLRQRDRCRSCRHPGGGTAKPHRPPHPQLSSGPVAGWHLAAARPQSSPPAACSTAPARRAVPG